MRRNALVSCCFSTRLDSTRHLLIIAGNSMPYNANQYWIYINIGCGYKHINKIIIDFIYAFAMSLVFSVRRNQTKDIVARFRCGHSRIKSIDTVVGNARIVYKNPFRSRQSKKHTKLNMSGFLLFNEFRLKSEVGSNKNIKSFVGVNLKIDWKVSPSGGRSQRLISRQPCLSAVSYCSLCVNCS